MKKIVVLIGCLIFATQSKAQLVSDTATTAFNHSLVIDVRANDSLLFSTCTFTVKYLPANSFYQPKHGSFIILNDDSIAYTPNTGFSGCDTFYYAVNSSASSSAACDTARVFVCTSPNPCYAHFTYTTLGDTVSFTNLSTGGTYNSWVFGDPLSAADTSTAINPTHIYNTPGTYLICIARFDSTCQDNYCDSIHIGGATNCHANFSIVANGNSVNVVNNSIGGTHCFWSFGDGDTSSLYNPPAHIYTTSGNYIICLTIYDSTCQSTFCDTAAISINNNCVANFNRTINNSTVTFIKTGTGGSFCFWTFGDGGSSSICDTVIHTYSAIGKFATCLTIYDSTCANTFCDTVTITQLSIGMNDPSTTLKVTAELEIYPNPCGESLVIRHWSIGNTIHIYDVLGREVFVISTKEESKSKAISVANLSSGVYFLKVTDEKGNYKMAKFVKQ